jgi:hypothetical protein
VLPGTAIAVQPSATASGSCYVTATDINTRRTIALEQRNQPSLEHEGYFGKILKFATPSTLAEFAEIEFTTLRAVLTCRIDTKQRVVQLCCELLN